MNASSIFCAYYSRTHSVREAAARAGFRRKPELNGIRLLEKESVRVEIERLEQRLHTEQEIRDGYRRLAFGPVTDAVKLYFWKRRHHPASWRKWIFSRSQRSNARAPAALK